MKITSAKVIVTCPSRNFVILKIITDQGLYGLGDGTLNGRELSVSTYLEEYCIPCLIGKDPLTFTVLVSGVYITESIVIGMEVYYRLYYDSQVLACICCNIKFEICYA